MASKNKTVLDAEGSSRTERQYYFGGREHTAIKHFFLKQYLEPLCFKTLQAQKQTQPTFTYIDGFSGPWSARDANYADTSFGVAITVLKGVKESLPNVLIKAVFCEERQQAYTELARFLANSQGSIETKPIFGRFEDHITEIQSFIGEQGFRFAFIDPTGWNVDVAAITPLLKGSWSEVVFNFMARFIGRFPDFEYVREPYSSLLGSIDWKSRYAALPEHMSNDEKVLQLFRDVLKEKWGFSHILELPVRKARHGSIFYKLVYGTRSPHGVLTFREAQAKAEKEGHAVEFASKTKDTGDLFSPDDHAEHIAASVGVSSRTNIQRLPDAITYDLQARGSANFLHLAANVLEVIPAREKDVKAAITTMGKIGSLAFTGPDARGSPTRKSIVSLKARVSRRNAQ
jgi:three-Cys-motif partner protein